MVSELWEAEKKDFLPMPRVSEKLCKWVILKD